MSFVDFFVGACFAVGILSALVVAIHPNILYAAVALIFSLLSVAGLYAALGADFLAGAQLIIYVGGVIVVILFAIMMSENIYRTRLLDGARRFVLPFCLAALLLIGLVRLFFRVDWPSTSVLVREPTTDAIGQALVGPYALIFQYVAVVLLAGLIGAVLIARPQLGEKSDKGSEV